MRARTKCTVVIMTLDCASRWNVSQLMACMGVNVMDHIMTITITFCTHLVKLRKACNVFETMQTGLTMDCISLQSMCI